MAHLADHIANPLLTAQASVYTQRVGHLFISNSSITIRNTAYNLTPDQVVLIFFHENFTIYWVLSHCFPYWAITLTSGTAISEPGQLPNILGQFLEMRGPILQKQQARPGLGNSKGSHFASPTSTGQKVQYIISFKILPSRGEISIQTLYLYQLYIQV